MTGLEEAIKIAEAERSRLMNSKSNVIQIIDCGVKWFMTFADDVGCCGTLPVFVAKDTGNVEFCLYNKEQLNLISTGIEVPKKSWQ